MTITNYGKDAMARRLGYDTPSYIACGAIGSGSGTSVATMGSLIGEWTRSMITTLPDVSTLNKITFQVDFNSVQMSGCKAMEFGLFSSGASTIGSLWQREGFGSIVFDGTNELQILSTLEIK